MTNTMNTPSHLVTLERLSNISTIIGPSSVVKGDMVTEPSTAGGAEVTGIKVDGRVDGSILFRERGGVIWIGPNGKVTGDIEADYIYVAGQVNGTLLGRRGVELTGTCTVDGNVEYLEALNTHNLARIRGNVQYAGQA